MLDLNKWIGGEGKRTSCVRSCGLEEAFESLREAEGGFFKETIEEFGDSQGDGESDNGAEPGAPEILWGETVDHVNEAESDAPVDKVDGIGAGTEILDDGIGKPCAHPTESGSEEDGSKGADPDEKSFIAAMEPHQDAGKKGKEHPAANERKEVGEGGEDSEGE